MVEFKLTINDPQAGKSYRKDITGKEAGALLGKDLGETISGDLLGFTGYEFKITGGSDYCGFPMRKGIRGAGRKKILLRRGVGFKGKDRWGKSQKGLRRKKTVCGQKIHPKIVQVNLIVLKEGKKKFEAEEKKEEKVEKKEAPKKEEKKKVEKAPKGEVKKEEAVKEEKKEAPKAKVKKEAPRPKEKEISGEKGETKEKEDKKL